jgi:Ca-activated chloride channel homolog
MKSRLGQRLFLASVLPALALPAVAADQAGRASQFQIDSTLVLINVAVTDAKGRFVPGLSKDNFRIMEDRSELELRTFSIEEVPLSIGLVLDFSGSMAGKLDRLREAVTRFVEISNPADEFCVIEFRDRPELVLGLGSSPEEIAHRLDLAEPKGQTALIDAIALGVQEMKKAHRARKALLVVTDGEDNRSRLRERQLEDIVRESDVQIYAIGIGRWIPTFMDGGSLLPRADALLEEITSQGGGHMYSVDRLTDLAAVAENIGEQLRHQYLLGYTPPSPRRDGKYHSVRVKLIKPPGQSRLSAYWRRGYYARDAGK